MMKRRWAFLFVGLMVLAGAASTWFFVGEAHSPATTAVNTGSDQVAIRGYDPVAYFETASATKGSPEISHRWSDAIWHFSSETHRNMFAGEPERFAPSYGGYCAMGMADGFIANIDPEAWAIVNGRLYLSRNKKLMDQHWRKKPSEYIARADANWQSDHRQLTNVWSVGP